MKIHGCEACRFKAYSERKPDSIIARLWRWHTKWCPGWKSYQRALADRDREAIEKRAKQGD